MTSTNNFSDLFITNSERNILNDLASGRVGKNHPSSVSKLIKLGLVSNYPLSDNSKEFVITEQGLDYLAYHKEVELIKHEAKIDKCFTRAISIIALVISIISLLLQLWK